MNGAILGIDPGQSGGIVILSDSGDVRAHTKMPDTDTDILHYLELWKHEQPTVFLEIVHSMPGNKAQSMFKFGMNYGAIRMAVLSCRYRLEGVRPQVWQKFMQCLTRGDKNVSKAKAQELFPNISMTHAIADAFLIAEYGRQQRNLIGPAWDK